MRFSGTGLWFVTHVRRQVGQDQKIVLLLERLLVFGFSFDQGFEDNCVRQCYFDDMFNTTVWTKRVGWKKEKGKPYIWFKLHRKQTIIRIKPESSAWCLCLCLSSPGANSSQTAWYSCKKHLINLMRKQEKATQLQTARHGVFVLLFLCHHYDGIFFREKSIIFARLSC